jgi:hypothetical protein
MDDTARMDFHQRFGHLPDEVERRTRALLLAHALAQIAAGKILHHDVCVCIGLAVTIDLRHVWMADLRDQVVFLQKPLQQVEPALAEVQYLEHARRSGRLVLG